MTSSLEPGYSVAKLHGSLIGGCVRKDLALELVMKSMSAAVGVPSTFDTSRSWSSQSWPGKSGFRPRSSATMQPTLQTSTAAE